MQNERQKNCLALGSTWIFLSYFAQQEPYATSFQPLNKSYLNISRTPRVYAKNTKKCFENVFQRGKSSTYFTCKAHSKLSRKCYTLKQGSYHSLFSFADTKKVNCK